MRPGRAWFARPPLQVAAGLLGAVLRVSRADGTVAVRLTEVEAYAGEADPGSHAFRGRTARNAVMFGPAGHLYVYRHLGLHHCVNVVTGAVGTASAVLLRAGEVVEGADVAWARRSAAGVVRGAVDLARGPARLTVALGLTLADNGADLLADLLGAPAGPADNPPAGTLGGDRGAIELEVPRGTVGPTSTGPRVGVAGPGGEAASYPWRLWLAGEPTVSVYRAAAPRRPRSAVADGAPPTPRGTAH